MDSVDSAVHRLRAQIGAIEEVLFGLKTQLANAEQRSIAVRSSKTYALNPRVVSGADRGPLHQFCNVSYETGIRRHGKTQFDQMPLLKPEEYKRYGRQMIMPEVGLHGQLCLKNSSVLVVGIGGLGCPAAMYLTAAGVGKIGLIDGDAVEVSNLHRQILHSWETIGLAKVESARSRLKGINSEVQFIPYEFHLTQHIAIDLFRQYDVILDCTDHPTTRYLVSDAAVLASRPVVSASALKTEGQLMVLNNPPLQPSVPAGIGHCYRCVFPKPPPAESVTSCGEGGILGPVVGVMGVLMATETLKLLLGSRHNEEATSLSSPAKPTMLLFSAFSDQPFRTIRLGGRRKNCSSCSSTSTIFEESLRSGSLDYTAFCAVRLGSNRLTSNQRISAKEYLEVRSSSAKPQLLVDVREKTQFDLAHLKDSINVPLSDIQNEPLESLDRIRKSGAASSMRHKEMPFYFICRFGNDSQLAVHHLCKTAPDLQAYDVRGGLDAWRREVDPGFPEY